MAFSYTLVTHDRAGREHARPYTSQDPLAPASVVLLGGRYWLVERVDDATVQARPGRYRLTHRHPDGHEEAGVFRRFRPDAPTVGHQLATYEDGGPVTWAVVEQRLARDDADDPFLESIAERDHGEVESLPDHQLEHTLEQDEDDSGTVAVALALATRPGLAVELVGLEPGQAPDWDACPNAQRAAPIDSGGWTSTVSTSASTGNAISALTIGTQNDLTLQNLGSISLTGQTGLRLHIDGGQPSGENSA